MEEPTDKGNGEGGSQDAPRARKKRRPNTPWPPDDVLREIIFKKAGINSQVADAIGMSIRAIQIRQKRSPKFRAMFEEARERLLDMGEAVIFEGISKKNMTAVIFFLKCQAKHRGWIERAEVTGAGGSPLFDPAIDARKISDGIRTALADAELRRKMAEMQNLIEARAARREGEDKPVVPS